MCVNSVLLTDQVRLIPTVNQSDACIKVKVVETIVKLESRLSLFHLTLLERQPISSISTSTTSPF